MSPQGVSPLAKAWYKWKALRLPWRKRFLVGFDLGGNTFWEFRLTNSPHERMRRIVKYPRSTHLSHVKVTPAWHQWLRYTREEPPSLDEQRDDLFRQERMRQLAAAADARWEAKPRLVEDAGEPAVPARLAPRGAPEVPGVESADGGAATAQKTGRGDANGARTDEEPAIDPWAQHKARGPSEKWQPSAWDPAKPKTP